MPAPLPAASASRTRFGGLDGLRAIAVGLVLCYHLFPGTLPGGFLGVDVFFAISGFLITSLLLRELDQTGRIRLGAFWRRRARRLLPALALVLLLCVTLALIVGGDLLVGIGAQVSGAALFVSNWVFIARGTDYFARDNPELFRNTWSLSIEEQFYILLPLLLLVLGRLRSRGSRMLPLAVLGIASAALMVGLSRAGLEPTRIYFGSDTHTFGLLLGAAMAALLHGGARRAIQGPARQATTLLVALAGFAILGWLAGTLGEGSPQSFQGGFQLATVASLAIVWAVTREGSWAGRALDAQPLRWIGERSYGIYLWHWPLLIIIRSALGPGTPGWATGAATLVLTLLLSALSYRYVEQPVRRVGLRRSLSLLFRLGGREPRRRVVAAVLGVVLLVTVPATAYAIATAPRVSSAEAAVARGQERLDAHQKDAPRNEDAGSPSSEDHDAEATDRDGAALAPEGTDVSAVGDSVMLASLPELEERFPGISVDAAVSRSMSAGVGIVSELAAQGSLRYAVLVGLGTNGPVSAEDLDALRGVAADRPLVLVNAHGERDWIPGVNQTLADFAAARRGVVVADWDAAISPSPDALAGDGIHPEPAGGELYAAAVQQALDELQQPDEAMGFALPRR